MKDDPSEANAQPPHHHPAIQDDFDGDHAICYGCGHSNPHGLHIRTHWNGKIGTFRFTPEDYHTAFPGIVYGGLIASLFDCHCIGTAIAAAYDAEDRTPGSQPAIMFVTANLNVNYVHPTPMGRELTLNAHIVETKGRKSVVACTLVANDVACANATVVAIRVS
jgi:acyl-coenzyme A thioesterase PaaI-like protein